MCGIVALVGRDDPRDALARAQLVQSHRGPNAHGSAVDAVGDLLVGLGHQRLSILDLSETGSQPMTSSNGGSRLIFNGEIYNYIELRDDLIREGHVFRGTSDTEVLLVALENWGPAATLARCNGMWAFAWLDLREQRLVIARDRVGKKPLYVRRHRSGLAIASEIKTLLAISDERLRLEPQIVSDYLGQSMLEARDRLTFFAGISKLTPGTFASIDLRSNDLAVEEVRYWNIPTEPHSPWSDAEAPERLRELLLDSVRLRLRSDVPVGILLSGGLDSSAVAACMRKLLGPDANLNCLSAVSAYPQYDESAFIERMARHLNAPVHKVHQDYSPAAALAHLKEVCYANDEPPGGFANVATYLLMKAAREQGITVILSGQGADELLCGYRKYLGFYLSQLAREGRVAKAVRVGSEFLLNGTVLREITLSELRRYASSRLARGSFDARGPALAGLASLPIGLGSQTSVMDRQIADVRHFSIPILTHYEDRLSMAFSREIRDPFLDYRLIEALLPAPVEWKLTNGWTKHILRRAMERDVPAEITWRKDKKGFDTPEPDWLRHDFRQDVLAAFSEDALIFRLGLLDRQKLLKNYDVFVRTGNRGPVSVRDIFNPLALELWLRRFEEHIAP